MPMPTVARRLPLPKLGYRGRWCENGRAFATRHWRKIRDIVRHNRIGMASDSAVIERVIVRIRREGAEIVCLDLGTP